MKKNKNKKFEEAKKQIVTEATKYVDAYLDRCIKIVGKGNVLPALTPTICDEIMIHFEAASMLMGIAQRMSEDIPEELRLVFCRVNIHLLNNFPRILKSHEEFFQKEFKKLNKVSKRK